MIFDLVKADCKILEYIHCKHLRQESALKIQLEPVTSMLLIIDFLNCDAGTLATVTWTNERTCIFRGRPMTLTHVICVNSDR